VDQAVLALLSLGRHEGYRTWKAFDWEVMGRLHQKGYISDPVGKAKSVDFSSLCPILQQFMSNRPCAPGFTPILVPRSNALGGYSGGQNACRCANQ